MQRQREACLKSQVPVVIVGGGLGGCAAALATCRAGHETILTEESRWIGGQLTSQAVPPDEHGWIERFGCTGSYRDFRRALREYYRRHYPLTQNARRDPFLNPGSGWVSPLCAEPRAAFAVLSELLAPYCATGRLQLLLSHRAIGAASVDDRVLSVRMQDLRTGDEREIAADYFLDATELGDLLSLAGVEHVTGAESQAQTGEPSAPALANPQNTQASSWCIAVDHIPGENHVIDRPSDYAFWRGYVPRVTPPWPGPLFSLCGLNPRTGEPVQYVFDPEGESGRAFGGLWTYRRILSCANFTRGSFANDISLVNWPMIDYLDGDLTGEPSLAAEHRERARQQSLSFLYWLQTEAPRHDGGCGWPGLRLRGDVLGTTDGLAMEPYIRESRRILAELTVTEQDISAAYRPGCTFARTFHDSVGIGSYRIDLHPSAGGDNYIDVPALPFQIPLRALLPVRVNNLLPAAKNLGVTHITNGCFRVHPVEWNVGEAAGSLAAFCLERRIRPRGVSAVLPDFQQRLRNEGFELEWPPSLDLSAGEPHIHAQR